MPRRLCDYLSRLVRLLSLPEEPLVHKPPPDLSEVRGFFYLL